MSGTTETKANREVDPWRFAGSFLKNALSGGIPDSPTYDPIPWTPVGKPLSECKVALLTTAGISMRGDAPFDMEMERKRATRGDPSWRSLRADATSKDIEANHLHIDTGYIERDLNVALPLDRLREAVAAGRVGAMAETHYSIMGYQGNDSSTLVEQSAPEIAAAMRNEEVDLALLTPV
jgi:D-proline reductase (dithiol) PrdB